MGTLRSSTCVFSFNLGVFEEDRDEQTYVISMCVWFHSEHVRAGLRQEK